MPRVTLVRRRSRIRAFVAAFVAAAQFAVVSFAPALDAQAGPGAPSHVEAFGIHKHFAHNPDDCAACIAQSFVAIAPAAPAPALESASAGTAIVHAPALGTARPRWRPDGARAPPSGPVARSLS